MLFFILFFFLFCSSFGKQTNKQQSKIELKSQCSCQEHFNFPCLYSLVTVCYTLRVEPISILPESLFSSSMKLPARASALCPYFSQTAELGSWRAFFTRQRVHLPSSQQHSPEQQRMIRPAL